MTTSIPANLLNSVGFSEFRRQVREEYKLCRSRVSSPSEAVDAEAELDASVRERWDSLALPIRVRFYRTGAYNAKLAALSQSALCDRRAESPTVKPHLQERKALRETWLVASPPPKSGTSVKSEKMKINPQPQERKALRETWMVASTPPKSGTSVTAEKMKIKPVVKKRRRSNKNANVPKKPKSPYVLFYHEEAKKLKRENPGVSMVNLSKEIATRWSSLDATAKQAYQDRANIEKARYAQEMASYTPPAPKPKASLSAYSIFVKERSGAMSAPMPGGTRIQTIAKEWTELDAAGREVFLAKAAADKKRNQREMAMYRQGKFVGPSDDVVSALAPDSDGDDPCQSDDSILASQ